ncbi:MAG TPA: hypothetical protein VG454_08210 [Gemmatimonadales bacterium]|nr:hypothetical protein [Gemmatimonadales bacterium]
MTKVGAFGVVLGIAAGFAAFVGACESATAPGGILLMGSWGSTQGRLTATQVNTTWSGSCGSGSTREPIMLDKHGHFDMVGLYGAAGTAQQTARFTGAISSKKLVLKVVMADSSVAFGPIMLDLGQQPALANCH